MVVSSLTRHLTGRAGDAPLHWRDDIVEAAVADAKLLLNERVAAGMRRRMSLEDPNWTLDSQTAAVHALYRLDSWRGIGETGWFRVRLARANGQWEVDGLSIEPAIQETLSQ